MKRLILACFCFVWMSVLFAHPIILQNVSSNNLGDQMNMVFHLSDLTQYRTFELDNPKRFVLDLRNTETFRQLQVPLDSGYINQFKYATHRNGVFRIVFGLDPDVAVSVKQLPLNPVGEARFEVTFRKNQTAAFSNSFSAVLAHNVFLPKKTIKNPIPTEAMLTPKPILTDNEGQSKTHRDIIIVVDPGHGGKDPGATGPGGTHEKTIVLSIAKKLQKWIDAQPGYKALLTRNGDYYLTLRQRLRIARQDKADMFIAIHADIWRNKTAGGVSVFALSQKGATSEAARWLAARENASELMGGVDLNDKSHLLKSVLINLSQAATIRSSLQIGNDLLQTIRPIARLHHDRVEQAAFVVLKSPDIPSLLVETGFLSNPNEEERLKNPLYQNTLAHAIQEGISEYFAEYPPRGTWLSYWKKHPSERRVA